MDFAQHEFNTKYDIINTAIKDYYMKDSRHVISQLPT